MYTKIYFSNKPIQLAFTDEKISVSLFVHGVYDFSKGPNKSFRFIHVV